MKQNSLVGLITSGVALFLANPSWSRDNAPLPFQPSPKTDTRGFVDVWQLRHDVAAIEPLETTGDADSCYVEGDPDNPLTEAQSKREERAEAACVAKVQASYAAYQKVWKAFNDAWLPVMREAIKRGDRVAEVIMRQCDTTSVLDRTGIESTCDAAEQRSAFARERLEKIGFVPAFDLRSELVRKQGPNALPHAPELNQAVILNRVRNGALAFDIAGAGIPTGNIAHDPGELQASMLWAVIEAATEDAPQAFTFGVGLQNLGQATSTLATLRLNRKPLTPGFLTWGPALHYGGSNELYTGPHYWRALPRRTNDESHSPHGIPVIIEGAGNPQFEHDRARLLAEIEVNIKRYLAEDPRWGVFLLHRVGHHEWEPEGTQSPTRVLGSTWEGAWALQKEARDWTSPMTSARGRALIERNGDDFQITVVADHEEDPFLNVERCNLRYSGASTYRPEPGPNGQSPRSTVFGYVAHPAQVAGMFDAEGANKEAVAALDASKSYSQVLMLCAGGESLDSARVRFLLLAGDTLIEVGASDPFHGPLSIRNYHRAQGDPQR